MGEVIGCWRVTRDGIEELSPNYVLPPFGEPDGMYYGHGEGSFALCEDDQTVLLGWQVGPRFGRGYSHKVEGESAGGLRLRAGAQVWVS